MTWKNLAPGLVRQRLIIEGTTEKIVEPKQIGKYLVELAKVSKMEILSGPFAYSAHELGFGGWVHWRTSGCHFYSYPKESPLGTLKDPLFTVDTYTCKPFNIKDVVEFTKQFFKAKELVWKEVKV